MLNFEALRLKKQQELLQMMTVATQPVKKQKKSLKRVLEKKTSIAVVAEIKRRSPSKGQLATLTDPVFYARRYQQQGVAAISVLTDSNHFSGSFADLHRVSTALQHTELPILCKDFIIDKKQLLLAKNAGADAVLLIMGLLEQRVPSFIEAAHALQLEVLLESYTVAEFKKAQTYAADCLGINNRNLQTLAVNLDHALAVSAVCQHELSYSHPTLVVESGFSHCKQLQPYEKAGFSAALVGEAMVKNNFYAEE